MAVQTLKENKQETVKSLLSDILMYIQWGDVSQDYFGQPGPWLYHKLNGIDNQNNLMEFTVEERYKLKGALVDLADRIRKAADKID